MEYLAIVETIDNGKAVRETLNADLPLAIDHFRYFASVIRAEEGSVVELNEHTVSDQTSLSQYPCSPTSSRCSCGSPWHSSKAWPLAEGSGGKPDKAPNLVEQEEQLPPGQRRNQHHHRQERLPPGGVKQHHHPWSC